MVALPFSKYSGAGNIFFLIDNRKQVVPTFPSTFLSSACFERGERSADGVILVENSRLGDFRMRIFNADGSEAQMCGNGLRAFIKYLQELGCFQPEYKIETGAYSSMGCLKGKVTEQGVLTSMGSPHSFRKDISMTIEGRQILLHFINTGVPHVVLFLESTEELEAFPAVQVGRAIRRHPYFLPEGTNVNFAVREKNFITLRTYERGVEDETLACGTGATASGLIASNLYSLPSPILIQVRSKEKLTLFFKQTQDGWSEVFLEGPVFKIGEGAFDLKSFNR